MEELEIQRSVEVETATDTRCRNCGAYVSRGFARVFGNNDDVVYGCLECRTMRDLREGGGIQG